MPRMQSSPNGALMLFYAVLWAAFIAWVGGATLDAWDVSQSLDAAKGRLQQENAEWCVERARLNPLFQEIGAEDCRGSRVQP